tara:strand:- start:136 stop:465 length:330 start_codon:yes stop_codon:yes gene_type:complete
MSDEDTVQPNGVVDYIQRGLGKENYFDRPERIARKVMIELVKAGYAEFLLLRDDEVSNWWGGIIRAYQEKIAKEKEKIKVYEIKVQAFNKLTAQERLSLGIRKPIKPKT